MSDEIKSGLDLPQVMEQLRKPFHPSRVTWKPGAVKSERGLALAYADLRAYMDRLDEVCGFDWSVSYQPWGDDRIICRLTIAGVTRSSTGESTNESERSEIGGTVAEAQAFKRACAMFGLGRYLYNLPRVWADFDPGSKQFTSQAKAKLTGILMQHYRRATNADVEAANPFDDEVDLGDAKPAKAAKHTNGTAAVEDDTPLIERFNALGQDLYGDQWAQVRQRNVQRISGGHTADSDELAPEQIEKLISGMLKVKSKRQPEAVRG
jgi:hypothetical protein